MDLFHKEDGLLSSTPSYRYMNHGSAPGEADEPTILAAARRNDAKEVRRFVNAGGDVNATNQHGQTALHMAAANGKTDTVIMLLDMGATASLKSTSGNTAAALAVKNGHDTVVKLLQKRGGLGTALRSGVNRPSMLGVAVADIEATSSGSGDGSGPRSPLYNHKPLQPHAPSTPSPRGGSGRHRHHRVLRLSSNSREASSRSKLVPTPPSGQTTPKSTRWRAGSRGSAKLILDAVDGLPSDLDSLLSSPASSVGSSSKRAFLFRQLGSSDRKFHNHGASGASGARSKPAGGSSGGARPPFEDSLSAVLPSTGFKRRNEHVHTNSPLAPRDYRSINGSDEAVDRELTLRRAELWYGSGAKHAPASPTSAENNGMRGGQPNTRQRFERGPSFGSSATSPRASSLASTSLAHSPRHLTGDTINGESSPVVAAVRAGKAAGMVAPHGTRGDGGGHSHTGRFPNRRSTATEARASSSSSDVGLDALMQECNMHLQTMPSKPRTSVQRVSGPRVGRHAGLGGSSTSMGSPTVLEHLIQTSMSPSLTTPRSTVAQSGGNASSGGGVSGGGSHLRGASTGLSVGASAASAGQPTTVGSSGGVDTTPVSLTRRRYGAASSRLRTVARRLLVAPA